MRFKVVLEPSDEGGFTIYIPSLPGCISEGDTVEDALKNIEEAAELYLEPVEDDWVLDDQTLVKEIDMNVTTVDEARLKDVVKTAVLEVFEERRDWLADLLGEALLDIGLGYAIQEGEQTPTVSRDEVFQVLEADA